ncbi:predicted protein [Nematostella vectensis]|uniref:Uncharacterized protein n=1 Tax=Nematostella vectensis TaxID=45351 RepID=A7RWL9_NEMVE|nr:predicted protein [Nematostella vectensis]|eukprot:XP_001636210.1 predicted protein [Nematostella vectensis]
MENRLKQVRQKWKTGKAEVENRSDLEKDAVDWLVYGEDPEPGATGPGQIRIIPKQEFGYIRIGMAMGHGIFEIEIIRALYLVTSHTTPDTYVKKYLIFDGKKSSKRKTTLAQCTTAA